METAAHTRAIATTSSSIKGAESDAIKKADRNRMYKSDVSGGRVTHDGGAYITIRAWNVERAESLGRDIITILDDIGKNCRQHGGESTAMY
jgi:hypothetical protein